MKKMKNIKRRELEVMPFDHAFDVREGITELCHSTGYEVKFPDDSFHWWKEYEDSEGNYHYGN